MCRVVYQIFFWWLHDRIFKGLFSEVSVIVFLYLWEISISETVVKFNGVLSLVGVTFMMSAICQVISGNREDVLVLYK